MAGTCKNCGAPMEGQRCEYCGYGFDIKNESEANIPISVKYLYGTTRQDGKSETIGKVPENRPRKTSTARNIVIIVIITAITLAAINFFIGGESDKVASTEQVNDGIEITEIAVEVPEEEMEVEEVEAISEEGMVDAEQTGEAAEVKEDNAESVLYIGEPSTKQGTYKLTGKIDDKYDIKIWLTINKNIIFGKYCYISTLEKYGDHPSSYIQFDGLISPADFFIIKASSKDSARADKWEGDFKENRLYAEKILETGEIRTMEAYIDE